MIEIPIIPIYICGTAIAITTTLFLQSLLQERKKLKLIEELEQ